MTSFTPSAAQTPAETCLANAQLVLEDRVITGRLTLRGGCIADLQETDTVPCGALDCGGDIVAPGLVELHTDNLERHLEPRPGVDWPHTAAIVAHDGELASAGITTVFDAMRVGSIPGGAARYRKYAHPLAQELLKLRTSGALKISHFLHLRAEVCSETLPAELAEFGPDDRVGLVSLMDHTPGQRQFRDINKMKSYIMGKRGLSEDEFTAHIAGLTTLRDRYGDLHEAVTVKEAKRLGCLLYTSPSPRDS